MYQKIPFIPPRKKWLLAQDVPKDDGASCCRNSMLLTDCSTTTNQQNALTITTQ
jgi:hypothetical protein